MSVNLGTAGKLWYQRTKVQTELLNFLQTLPVCVGVKIWKTLLLIEEFYGILSESPIKIKYVDLEFITHIAGWQLRGFSMTSMGVKALGTILNRCVGTDALELVKTDGDRSGNIFLDL